MSINRQEADRRVLKVIGELRHAEPATLNASDDLVDRLGFDSEGKRALAAPLNREFQPEKLALKPGDTGGCTTVGNVQNAVWENLPAVAKSIAEGGPQR